MNPHRREPRRGEAGVLCPRERNSVRVVLLALKDVVFLQYMNCQLLWRRAGARAEAVAPSAPSALERRLLRQGASATCIDRNSRRRAATPSCTRRGKRSLPVTSSFSTRSQRPTL